jgi:RNA polymerase sigma factor for flagellar operon FliA
MPSTTAPLPALTATQEQLVTDNLVLVNHLAQSALSRVPAHVSKDELTSAGLLALVTCARDFDPGRGVPFAGYASTRIRGSIVDEMRSRDWATRSVRRRARELDGVRENLTAVLGRTPTSTELAQASGYDVTAITEVGNAVAKADVGSLDGHSDTQLERMLPPSTATPEEMVVLTERLGYLHDAVDELPERLRRVVEGYFFAEMPMADLAEELEVSESRISQMRSEAVQLMRAALAPVLGVPNPQPASTRTGATAARRRDAYVHTVATRSSTYERLNRGAAVLN